MSTMEMVNAESYLIEVITKLVRVFIRPVPSLVCFFCPDRSDNKLNEPLISQLPCASYIILYNSGCSEKEVLLLIDRFLVDT
jgi:hypothetical protein